ncbi:MAG TPA: AarF/UbiB family protein [Verrucomicrobiae bacterium]|jgi:predicted unusual protein kinase regulating ubiquinone biosynthesis (AarF/ABC1/UbiB family)
MKISSINLKRFKEIAALLWKYGHSDLVRQMNFGDELDAELREVKTSPSGKASPEELADDLEAMGPTFIKIGQLLSSRSDLLPPAYLEALARLQDNVKPFSFEEVEQIILSELGVRVSKAFSDFNPKPIAAASLGQVHGAALRDGRQVIVKVQRPDIRKQIAADFEVLSQIAELLDTHTEFGRRYRFVEMLEEFRVTIQQELDYEREAQNLVILSKNLEEFDRIRIPQPVDDFTTRSVLTMDYIQGRKITALSPLTRLDTDGKPLAEELFKAYLKQIMVDGMFHADPHPGNVFLTDDGRIALLDLGMVGHLSPGLQENLLKLLMAVGEENSEMAADIVTQISEVSDDFDRVEFHRRLARIMTLQQNQSLEHLNAGRALMKVSRAATDSGLYAPSELTLLGKTLLHLDEVGKIIDPEFDPFASIRRNVPSLVARRAQKTLTPGNLFSSMLEMKDFVAGLPRRCNRLMDALTNSELEVKIKTVDTATLVEGFQKIANRITAGILLASLILGASLLMRVQTSYEIFGYPALAIVCFLFAAAGGLWLLFSIFFQDEKIKKSKKPRLKS